MCCAPALLQIDPAIMCKHDPPPAPLLEIQLELVAPDVVWKPDLGECPDGKVRGLCKRCGCHVCPCVRACVRACVCVCVCVCARLRACLA